MPNATENMPLPDAEDKDDVQLVPPSDDEKPALDAFDAAQTGVMSSGSDEDESDYVPKKRKRETEKAAEYDQAEAWVTAVFDDAACKDRVAALAAELAHWRRTAKKATRELDRIKRACSCGRTVNYPFILR
jgi:hypothetical protein